MKNIMSGRTSSGYQYSIEMNFPEYNQLTEKNQREFASKLQEATKDD